MIVLTGKMAIEERGDFAITKNDNKPKTLFIYLSIIGLLACMSYYFSINCGRVITKCDIRPKHAIYRPGMEKFRDSVSRLHFVLGVLSKDSNIDMRNVHRNTWISALQSFTQHKVSVRFLIDQPTDEMLEENKQYKDLAFLNSSYVGRAVHYGEKLYLWLSYAHHNFPKANIIGKMDDDVFLCIPQILNRVEHFYNQTMYYGWAHEHYGKISIKDRVDEMFIVLGSKLVERIVQRRYCSTTKGCNIKQDLVDTDFGGTSMGIWLSIYDDIRYIADNKKLIHSAGGLIKAETVYKEFVKDLHFCSKYLLCHKVVNATHMKMMHNYNKISHE